MKNHTSVLLIYVFTMITSINGTEHEQYSKIKSLSQPPQKTIKGAKRTTKERKEKAISQQRALPEPITPQPSPTIILNEDSSYEDIIAYLEQSIRETVIRIQTLQKENVDKNIINYLLLLRSFRQSIKNALQSMNVQKSNIPEEKWREITIIFINSTIHIAQSLSNIIQTKALDNNDRYAIAKLKDHPLLQQQDWLRYITSQLQNWNEFNNACTTIHNVIPEFPLFTLFLPQERQQVVTKEEPRTNEQPQNQPVIVPEKIILEQSPIKQVEQHPEIKPIPNVEELRKKHDEKLAEARREREEKERSRIERKTQEENSWSTWIKTNLNPFTWIDNILFTILPPIFSFIRDMYAWITSGSQR